MESRIRELLDEARSVLGAFVESPTTVERIAKAAQLVVDALRGDRKVLLCGNGGSAADCQHIAGEIVGRFRRERPGYAAIALTTDTSVMTAVANDYSYDDVFRRQVEALGQAGDVLVAYSTSGNSRNVVKAIEEARRKGIPVIGMTGSGGGAMASLVDVLVEAPAASTARAQECHALAGHVMCELVEAALAAEEDQ